MKTWVLLLSGILILVLLYLVFTAASSTIKALPSLMARTYSFNSFTSAVGAYLSAVGNSATLVYKTCIPTYWHEALTKYGIRASTKPCANAIYVACDGCELGINFENENGLHDVTHCPSSYRPYCRIAKTSAGATLTLPLRYPMPASAIDGEESERHELTSPIYAHYYGSGVTIPETCQEQIVKMQTEDATMLVYEKSTITPDCELLFVG